MQQARRRRFARIVAFIAPVKYTNKKNMNEK